jgi:hypothetical protein
MEKISRTTNPPQLPSEQEWMREFNVGILAPKPNNGRASEMMAMWSNPTPRPSFLEKCCKRILHLIGEVD